MAYARHRNRSNSYLEAVFGDRGHASHSSNLLSPTDRRDADAESIGSSRSNIMVTDVDSHSQRAGDTHSLRGGSSTDVVTSSRGAVTGDTKIDNPPSTGGSASFLNVPEIITPSDQPESSSTEAAQNDNDADDVVDENRVFPYHPLNTAAQDKGYLGNLTETQTTALSALKERVHKENLGILPYLCKPAESVDHFLLRFLRARQFHVAKAWDMLKTDVEWRAEQDVLALRAKPMADIVQCDVALIHHHLPIWQQGFDKQGRPVVYKKFGRCEISTLKQHTAIENLVRFHVWSTERQLLALGRQSKALGMNIETFLFVIDAGGWTVRLASTDAFRYLKGLADMDSAHYPERLGAIVIVNAPLALDIAWRVVQVWLDARTKAKVHIMRRGSQEALQKLIDLDQIPADYGGQAPALKDPPAEQ